MKYPSMFCNVPIPLRASGNTFTNNINNGGRLALASVSGIPYGLYGRLALVALTTLACNSKANEILHCDSLYSILKNLKKNKPTGTQLEKFEKQIISWSNTLINFSHISKTYKEYRNLLLVDRSTFALAKNGQDRCIDVQFTSKGKRFLTDHALPISLDIIKDIEQPFVFDVLVWLNLSLFSIKEDEVNIPWSKLYSQFLVDKTHYASFRTRFMETLNQIRLNYYLEARFETDGSPDGGILLKKSNLLEVASFKENLFIPSFTYPNKEEAKND